MPEAAPEATSRRTALFAGLAIFVLFAVGQTVWIVLDQWPQASDPVVHYRYLQALHWSLNHSPGDLLPFRNEFPPLLFLVALLFVQLFGLTADAVIFSGLIFSFVLYAATYHLARQWLHRSASLAAATLVLLFPVNLVLSRLFFTDYALGATVALALALLADRRVFNSPHRAVFLGLALGAGMLVKWTFPIFLVAPLLIRLLVPNRSGGDQLFADGLRRGLRLPVGLTICLGTACLVTLPWYLANHEEVFARFVLATEQNTSNLPGGFRLDPLYYPRMIPHMVSLPGLLLCLAGVWAMIRRSGRGALFLLGAALPATLIHSLMPAHWPRYLVPILPAMAVLAAAWLPSRGRWRPVAVPLIVLALIWAAMYSFSSVADGTSRIAGLLFPGPAHLELDVARPAIAPRRWVSLPAVEQTLDLMSEDSAEPVCFVVPYSHFDFNHHTLRYLAIERHPDGALRFVPSFRGLFAEPSRVEDLLESRWVLHKPKAVYYSRAGLDPLKVRPTESVRRIMARLLEVFPRRFEHRLAVPFSDGVVGALYRRQGEFEPEEVVLALQTARVCGPLEPRPARLLAELLLELGREQELAELRIEDPEAVEAAEQDVGIRARQVVAGGEQ